MTQPTNIEFQVNLKDNFTPNANKINNAANDLAQNTKKLNEANNSGSGSAEKNAKSLKEEAGAMEQLNQSAKDAANSVNQEGNAEKQSGQSIRERLAAIREQNIALKEKIALEERTASQNLANAKNNLTGTKTDVVNKQAATVQAEILALEERRVAVQAKIAALQKEQELQAKKVQLAEAAIAQSDEKKALAEARKQTAILQTTRELERQKAVEAQIEAQINKNKSALDKAAQSAATMTKNMASGLSGGSGGVGGTGGVDLIRLYSFGSLATQLAGLYASLRAIAFPIQEAAEFERALSVVKAIADSTDESFQNLTNTIIDMSKSTEFTATEITKAAQAFAAAGYSVDEMVGTGFNALLTTLQLAQVGMVDTATAADILIKSLSSFALPISEIGRVGDVLAAAANATNVSVAELGVSLSYVAPIAGAMGLSIEEVIGPLAQLSNYGLKGSMAATALRGTFSALVNPTKDEAKLLSELGRSLGQTSIQLYDSQGAFIGLGNVMKQFEQAGLSVGEAMKLFGDRAGTGVTALMREGSLSINSFINDLTQAEGSLARASEVIGANLTGNWKQFLATMSQAAIQLGSAFTPAVSSLVQSLSSAGSGVASFIQDMKGTATIVGTVVTAVGSLAIGLKSISAIKSLGAWLVSDLKNMTTSLLSVSAASKAAALETLGLTAAQVGSEAATQALVAAKLELSAAELTEFGAKQAVAAASAAVTVAHTTEAATAEAAAIAELELAAAEADGTVSAWALMAAQARVIITQEALAGSAEASAAAEGILADAEIALANAINARNVAQGKALAGDAVSRIGAVTLGSVLQGLIPLIGKAAAVTVIFTEAVLVVNSLTEAFKKFFSSFSQTGEFFSSLGDSLQTFLDKLAGTDNPLYKWLDKTDIGHDWFLSLQQGFANAMAAFDPEQWRIKAEIYFDKSQTIGSLEQMLSELEDKIENTKAEGDIIPQAWLDQVKKLKKEIYELRAERAQLQLSDVGEDIAREQRQNSINNAGAGVLKQLTKEAADTVAEATNAIKEKTAQARRDWEEANNEASRLSTQLVNLEDAFKATADAASALVSVDSSNMKTALKNMWDNVFTGPDISKAEAGLQQLTTATIASEQERADKIMAMEAQIRQMRIAEAGKAASQMETLLSASSNRQLQIYELENQKAIGVIKSRGLETGVELAQITAQEEKHARQVAELAAQVAQKKKEGYETALKAAQQNLDAIYAKEKSIMDKINQLQKDKSDSQNSANSMIRELERGGMSEIDAYNDKMSEINDNISEGARLMQTDYAAGLAMLKQAQSDAKGLGGAIKDGETDILSQSDAISNAINLIKSAQDAILAGASAQEGQLKDNLSALQQEEAATKKVADAYKEQLNNLQNNQEIMININIDFQQADKKIQELIGQKEMVVKIAADYGQAKAEADKLKTDLDNKTVKLKTEFEENSKTKLLQSLKEWEHDSGFKLTPVVDDSGFITKMQVMKDGWKETRTFVLDNPVPVTADMTEAEKLKRAIASLANMPINLKVNSEQVKAAEKNLQDVTQKVDELDTEKWKLQMEDNTPEVQKRLEEISKQKDDLVKKQESLKLEVQTNAPEVGKQVQDIISGIKNEIPKKEDTKIYLGIDSKAAEWSLQSIESVIGKLPDKKTVEIEIKSDDFQSKLENTEKLLKNISGSDIKLANTEDINELLGAFNSLNVALKEEKELNIDSSKVKDLEEALEVLKVKIVEVSEKSKVSVDTAEAQNNIKAVEETYKNTASSIQDSPVVVGIDSEAPKLALKEIATMLRTELPDEKEVQIKMASEDFQEQLDAASETIKNFTDLEINVKGADDVDDLIAAFSVLEAKLKEEKKLDVKADPEKIKEIEEALDAIKTKIVDVSKEKIEVVDKKTENDVKDIAEKVEDVGDAVEDKKSLEINTKKAEEHLEGVQDILKEIEDMELEPTITPEVDANEAKAELDALCKDRTVTVKVKTVQEKASGGIVDQFAEGGYAFRRLSRFIPGDGNKDDVPALLMKGEYILRKSAVKKFGVGFLDALNNGKVSPDNLPKFASGGFVGELSKHIRKLKYLNDPKAPISYGGVTYQLANPTFVNSVQNRVASMQSPLGMESSGTLIKLFNDAIPKMAMGGGVASSALTGVAGEASEIQRKYNAKISQASASGQIEVAKMYREEAKELKKLELELKQTLKQIQQDLAETMTDLADALKDAEEDKKDSFDDASEDYQDALADIADKKADIEKDFAEKLKEVEDAHTKALQQVAGANATNQLQKQIGGKFFDPTSSNSFNRMNMRREAEQNYNEDKQKLENEKRTSIMAVDAEKSNAEILKKKAEQEAITVYVKAEQDNKQQQDIATKQAETEKSEAQTQYNEDVKTVKDDTAFEVSGKQKEIASNIANLKAELEAELMALRRKAAEAAANNTVSYSGSSSSSSRVSGQTFWLNSGGYIPKTVGTPGIDSVPAMLTPGEMVIKAPVVDSIGKNFFDMLNAGKFNTLKTRSQDFPYLGKLDISLPGGSSHNVFAEQDVASKLQREVALMAKRMVRR